MNYWKARRILVTGGAVSSVLILLNSQAHQLEMFETNMRLRQNPVSTAQRCGADKFCQVSRSK